MKLVANFALISQRGGITERYRTLLSLARPEFKSLAKFYIYNFSYMFCGLLKLDFQQSPADFIRIENLILHHIYDGTDVHPKCRNATIYFLPCASRLACRSCALSLTTA